MGFHQALLRRRILARNPRRPSRPVPGRPVPGATGRLAAAFVLLLALGTLSACRTNPPAAPPEPFFAGIALALYGHPPDPALAEADLAAISSLGATGVVLPLFWTSRDVTSTSIEPFAYGVPQEAYDRNTIEIARRARARGLAVGVMPIVRLEKLADGEWRGTLRPSDWAAWWASYRRFLLHHAALARAAGAAWLCVGSELGTTEGNREEWLALIGDVRRVFPGRLIYSANWDHYESVSFWDALDGIGLSAYSELAPAPGAAQAELDAAWRARRDRILAWASPLAKPLFLTEVGYPSQSGAAVHPWDYTLDEPADPEAQARCYRAFASAWSDAAGLRGVTIWVWEHGRSGLADRGYAIDGKPAAAVVREFFRRRTSPGPAPAPPPG